MAEEYVTLNTGAKMPSFGLGTWLSKPGEVGAAVDAALRGGYKHVDCAHIYGNEREIGEAFRKCFEDGVVKRDEIFITSKLWNADHENVLSACEVTLKNLGLVYLDLYLVHWPCALRQDSQISALTDDDKKPYNAEAVAAMWKSMEELLSKGLVKAIGISNFTITKTENLLKTAKIVPAVNQVECHPYFQQQKLKEYCDSKGIIMEAYSPLGNPGRPTKFQKDDDPVVLEDPTIKEIADKHNAKPAQVCIAFAIHRGLVVIPKTVNLDRVTENYKSTEIKLDAEDMRKLREVDKNRRLLTGKIFYVPDQTEEEFWDVELDSKFEATEQEAKKLKSES